MTHPIDLLDLRPTIKSLNKAILALAAKEYDELEKEADVSLLIHLQTALSERLEELSKEK